MPNKRVRSKAHLRHTNSFIAGPACGSDSDRVLSRAQFLKADSRCQHCDRIAAGLKANAGGRPASKELKFTIVLSGLSPETFKGLQRLAGESIGQLIIENAEQLRSEIMDTKHIDIKEMEAKAMALISLGGEYFEICKKIAQVSTVDEFIEPFIGDVDPIGEAISSVLYHFQATSESIPKDFTKALRVYCEVNQVCAPIRGGK